MQKLVQPKDVPVPEKFRRFCGSFWFHLLLVGLVPPLGCRRSPAPVEYRIVSSSMSPTLQGRSRQATCISCQSQYRVASETFRPELLTRCYCCGGICRVDTTSLAGDVVRLVPIPDSKSIERFDLIAFQSQNLELSALSKDAVPSVKRVWGLPGETLRISDGEIWVNGNLLQKSLDDLQRLAVPLVRFPSSQFGVWQLQSATGGTRSIDALQSTCALEPGEPLTWSYRRPAADDPRETTPDQWRVAGPIWDDYLCNQGLSYQMQPVNDYVLSIKLTAALQGELQVTCMYHNQRVQITLAAEGSAAPNPESQFGRLQGRTDWKIALCDDRLLMRSQLAERIVDWEALKPYSHHTTPDAALVTITSLDGKVELSELEIRRDVYVRTTQRQGDGEQQFVVPENCFFVMGDNFPASVDSRNGEDYVVQERVLGQVEKR